MPPKATKTMPVNERGYRGTCANVPAFVVTVAGLEDVAVAVGIAVTDGTEGTDTDTGGRLGIAELLGYWVLLAGVVTFVVVLRAPMICATQLVRWKGLRRDQIGALPDLTHALRRFG